VSACSCHLGGFFGFFGRVIRRMTGMTPDSHYEIRVLGSLDRHWAAWFDGLQVNSDGSQTVICGLVADQAALHGLLNKVCGLGLVLISVRRLDPE